MAMTIPPIEDANTVPTPEPAQGPPTPDTAQDAAALPQEPPSAPEKETDEQWILRFLEENQHLARPRPERPPAPPPSMWDGPISSWKVPDHLSMRHPKGGYMAMALMSRTMDDLDEVTGGKRAATYEEVDKYLGHALIAEGLVPFTHTADEAIRWWKSGGYKVLGGTSVSAPANLSDTSFARSHGQDASQYSRDEGRMDEPHLTNATFMVDPDGETSAQPKSAIYSTMQQSPVDAAGPATDDGSIAGSLMNFASYSRLASLGGESFPGAQAKRPAMPVGTEPSGEKRPGKGPVPANSTKKIRKEAAASIRKEEQQYAAMRIAIEDLFRPEVQAIFDVISFAEGTEKYSYNTLFSGKRFDDLTRFPYRKGTTASGRYQINKMTYEEVADKFGLRDFSPFTQDIIATYKLQHTNVLAALLSGDLDTALSRASRTWASIPVTQGGTSKYEYGGKAQPSKSFEALKSLYLTRLEFYRAREKKDPYVSPF